jgi:hypothetical protein
VEYFSTFSDTEKEIRTMTHAVYSSRGGSNNAMVLLDMEAAVRAHRDHIRPIPPSYALRQMMSNEVGGNGFNQKVIIP